MSTRHPTPPRPAGARLAAMTLALLLVLPGAARLRAQADEIERSEGEAAEDGAADAAAERIRDFQARIVVDEDGKMTVTETIAVTAAGEQIAHGIYRDFPTVYYRDFGLGDRFALPMPLHVLRRTVPFDVVEVRRDGRSEPYHGEEQENGERIYVGAKDVTLPSGPYTYTLRYTTARQLGFFDDHDELYWNVTGTGWAFPIQYAAATVVLPAAIPRDRIALEGYTGPQGAIDRHFRSWIDRATGELHFVTTKPLGSYEGLTIVASFPKGYVRAPTQAERRAAWLRDNPILVIGPAALLLIVLYYAVAWVLVGRDPRRGTIIPLFDPPQDLDAASLRYVAGMGYDERCFSAGLVGLASKGWARIEEADGEFTLVSSSQRHTPLGAAEKRLNGALLSGGSIALQQKNHSRIRSAISGLRETLQREYDGTLFRANRNWVIPGLVLSAIAILAAGFSGGLGSSMLFGFLLIWSSVWTVACFHLVIQCARAWRELLVPGRGAFARIGAGLVALITTAFALPFLFAELFVLGFMMYATSILLAPVLLVLVGVNFLFLHLLKRPTLAGRKVMDAIEGFKMYLTTAEGAELALAAPAKTPQLYERLLPYAIALGVENQWAEQFSDVLARAAESAGTQTYHPAWYAGSSFDRFGSSGFASALNSSLSSSIASSSTAPGSSSGSSSSGGSSGGGGGGGGGGGW